jgi:hypothetical protein
LELVEVTDFVVLGDIADLRECINLLVLAAAVLLAFLISSFDFFQNDIDIIALVKIASRPRLEPQRLGNLVSLTSLLHACHSCSLSEVLLERFELPCAAVHDVDEFVEVGVDFLYRHCSL